MRPGFVAGPLLAAVLMAVAAQASPLDIDPPADAANPAALVEVTVPSHGVPLLGTLYLAAGAGPHPTVILYHGFPGFELNLDLAQALRRDGYNVLAAHYRGSWGVKGSFSVQHAIEDADAEVAWARSAAVAAKYRIDPAHLVVIGHSLGGYMALSAAAHDPVVAAAISISGSSMTRYANLAPADREKFLALYMPQITPIELLTLTGTSARALAEELFDHRREWNFEALAPSLVRRPVLLITANDTTGPDSETLAQALTAKGDRNVRHIEMKTDHLYSDHRIALIRAILDWLEQQRS